MTSTNQTWPQNTHWWMGSFPSSATCGPWIGAMQPTARKFRTSGRKVRGWEDRRRRCSWPRVFLYLSLGGTLCKACATSETMCRGMNERASHESASSGTHFFRKLSLWALSHPGGRIIVVHCHTASHPPPTTFFSSWK